MVKKYAGHVLLLLLVNTALGQNISDSLLTTKWIAVDQSARPQHQPYKTMQKSASPASGNIQTLKTYNKGKPRICLVVEAEIYDSIKNALNIFAQSLSEDGYTVLVSTFGSGTAENLRLYLQTLYQSRESLSGAFLIGDLPYVIYEMMQTWPENSNRFASGYEDFACDLYFMDLDGDWHDNKNEGLLRANNHKLDHHSGDKHAEIWVCRLKTDNLPLIGEQAELLNTYFMKNEYYRQKKNFPHKVLIYNDDDWQNLVAQDKVNFSQIYPENQIVAIDHSEKTSRSNYISSHLSQPYELIHIRAHGNNQSHVFYQDGHSAYNSVGVTDYIDRDPQAYFYSLYICSASDYTRENNLAAIITFNPDTPTLLSWGSSKTGGLYKEKLLYQHLGRGDSFGSAFLKWFNNIIETRPEEAKKWVYGMVLTGDATLNPLFFHDFQEKNLLDDLVVQDFYEIQTADFDRDGYADFLTLGGNHANPLAIKTYFRNSSDDFVAKPNHIISPDKGCVSLADMNGDGLTDVLVSGRFSNEYKTVLYKNCSAPFAFSGFEKIDLGIKGVTNGYIAADDVDNDGDLDIFISGLYKGTPSSFMYLNTSATITTPLFQPVETGIEGLVHGQSEWLDIDNDLDKDLFITGSDASGNGIVRLYINNYDKNSNRLTLSEANTGFPAMTFSKFAWEDYDQDGFADLALMGNVNSQAKASIYRNRKLSNAIHFDLLTDMASIANGDICWADFNNDGQADLFLTGEESSRHYRSALYQNNLQQGWEKIFAPHNPTTGIFAFLDSNKDTKLDFALVGKGGINKLYINRNERNNSEPGVPAQLNAFVLGQSATFSWQAPQDDHTPAQSLAYNLRVGTEPGKGDIFAAKPLFAHQLLRGNVNLNNKWKLYLQPGRYYWSVQAIDGAYACSAYSPPQRLDISNENAVYLKIKLILEGFFDKTENKMTTRLNREQLLPNQSPYRTSTKIEQELPAQIVDWINMEFTPSNASGGAVAFDFLLDFEGNVLSTETFSPYLNLDLKSGVYDIIIRHRNHLSVKVSSISLYNQTVQVLDLTADSEIVETKMNIKKTETGFWALRSGDLNQNGTLDLDDFSLWFEAAITGKTNYLQEDINGDGMVTTRDYLLWHNNFIFLPRF